MQNWTFDPKTGDYVMSGGAPLQTNALLTPAYIRLKTRRTQWMYAPDSKYGSDLHKIKNKKAAQNRQIASVEAAAARALQPMADDGRAQSITVDLAATQRGYIGLDIAILQSNGQVETLNLPSIGV
jgi:phage gp46-like protein